MHSINSKLVSYELIGLALGISKQRVRVIEQRALLKLRVAYAKRGFKTSDGLDYPHVKTRLVQ
jgi:DNA-directed RNA polymerase sigma subunit (sigma70/sigma32)